MSERGRWVIYFESGGLGSLPSKRRYLRVPGAGKYRGMYRSRRLVGHTPAVWTDDVAQAARFRSPSEAKRSRWTIAPARWERIHFERLEGV